MDSYLPDSDPDTQIWSHGDSGKITKVTKQMFYQFAWTLDKLMKKRLLSVSHFSSTFLSAVVEELRLTLQAEHKNQSKIEFHLAVEIREV